MRMRYLLFFVLTSPLYSQNFWNIDTIPGVRHTINSLVVDASGRVYAATNGKGIYRSTDDGASWQRLDAPPMQAHYYCIAVQGNTMWAGSYGGYAYRSTDNGVSWQRIAIDTLGVSIITSFAFPNDNSIVAGTGTAGIFSSVDNGVNWHPVSFPPSVNVFPLSFDGLDNLYAGTYGSGIYRSSNFGRNWRLDGLAGQRVNAMAPNPAGGLFAATDAGVFVQDSIILSVRPSDTTKRDTSHYWRNANDTARTNGDSLIHSTYVSSVVSSGGHLVAGTAGRGAFHSTDLGHSWERVNTGLVGSDIRAMAVNQQGYVYCGTLGGFVFKSAAPEPITPANTPRPGLPPPKRYVLEQNFPNPFNPTTFIPFAMPVSGRASIKIYNTMGQEVATVLDQEMTAGPHTVKWDASGFPSGMYFYRFQSASFSQAGKLMLMK